MPLAHAILGFLEYQPLSGYDLKKLFDQSVAHFWSATQSHIYKALENLEAQGWAQSEFIPQEGKPNRKQYQITPAGRAELARWVSAPQPVEVTREAWLIQLFFSHGSSNQQIVELLEARKTGILQRIAALQHEAQAALEQNAAEVGVERMRQLWQMSVDYGLACYSAEIAWLEQAIEQARDLVSLAIADRQDADGD